MTQLGAITEYRLTDHALTEMARRQITAADIAQVLSAPEQTETERIVRRGLANRERFLVCKGKGEAI